MRPTVFQSFSVLKPLFLDTLSVFYPFSTCFFPYLILCIPLVCFMILLTWFFSCYSRALCLRPHVCFLHLISSFFCSLISGIFYLCMNKIFCNIFISFTTFYLYFIYIPAVRLLHLHRWIARVFTHHLHTSHTLKIKMLGS